MILQKEFESGLVYEKYPDILGDNLPLHQRHYNRISISKEYAAQIRAFKSAKILAITEPWCGDSIALLPLIQRICECHGNWELRIALRDENPDLIDRFLTRGGRAIPIFIFLNSGFELIFHWGPRPKAAQDIFEQHRKTIEQGRIEKAAVIRKIRTFYSRDKGQTSLKELMELLHEHEW